MRWKIRLLFILVLAGLLSGCDFDKAVDVALPQQAPQLFVECYLRDSTEPRLALSLTQGYFDSVSIAPVFFGTVYLEAPDGHRIDLQAGIYIDDQEKKVYNWAADEIIRLKAGETWKLTCEDTTGRKITASSVVMAKIPIDSVTYEVRTNDTAAYCATWVKDPGGKTNYYRLLVNRDSISGEASTDFASLDNFRDGTEAPFRTGYVLTYKRRAFVRLYSLEPNYYAFLQSVAQAQRNNGNPFAQPNRLKATVQGGLGAFTTLVYDERSFVLEERKGKVL